MKRKYEIAVVSKGAFARTLCIYAPKKADRAIIMHDGQNAFYDSDATFGKSWRMLELLKAAGITNTAVIGIDSTASRDDDYMPLPTDMQEQGFPVTGGKAYTYADYIETAIIPYLDKRFGFKFYGMLGASSGALATAYFAARKNNRFRAYGMFSTPLFVNKSGYARLLDESTFDENAYYAVYCGGNETEDVPSAEFRATIPQLYIDSTFSLVNALRKSNVKDLWLSIENTAVHDENSWRVPTQRFVTDFSKLHI